MLNKLLFLVGACFLHFVCNAQLVNNGADIIVQASTTVTLTGNGIKNNAGTISHSGTIRMNGNLLNNATFTGNVGSLVRMEGTTEQAVQGSSVVNVYNFEVDNGGNGVHVSNTGSLRVSGQLQLTNGRLFTANASPVHFTPTASNPVETNTNHIVGTAIMESRAVGTAAFGPFLGFSMAAGADVGNLELTRRSGHGTTTPGGFTPTQGFVNPIGFESIDAHWVADVTDNNISRDITISWFPVWDNGKNLSQMQLWRTNIPFTIASPWVLKTIGTVNMSSRTHTATVPNGELRNAWTVSDLVNPLPVDLLNFDVRLLDGKDVEISWFTQNEYNLSHYTIERSADNLNFETIYTRKANNQAQNSYKQLDPNAKDLKQNILYYRLAQFDQNAKKTTTPSKAVHFDKPFYVGIYPNPFRNELNVRIFNPEEKPIRLALMDNLGRELLTLSLQGKEIETQIDKYTQNLAAGAYFLKISQETNIEIIKIIKQ